MGAVRVSVNLPNPGSYYALLGQHIIALREAIQDLVQDGEYLNAMGGAAFLEAAPFNLAPADATAVANIIGPVVSGNTTVQAIETFLTSAIPLTGGN